MKTALDSNVLSAHWSNEPSALRIEQALLNARAQGSIVVCAPVYAELAAHPLLSPARVDRFLAETGIAVDFVLDEAVWRKAAEGFAAYAQRRRHSGGAAPKRLLPDFIIGAHALLRADRFMTLDEGRYLTDFPTLRLAAF
jgi:predicted nucleic acid-binding protein